MSYCKSCHITYHTPLNHCLFCNYELMKTDDKLVYHYPEMVKERQFKKNFQRFLAFISFITILVCIYLDFVNGLFKEKHWSLFVISSVLFVDAVVYLFTGRQKVIRKLAMLAYSVIIYLLLIGIFSGTTFWAMDFIYPLVLITLNLCVTLYYLIGHSKELHDFAIYMLIPSLLGIVCLFHLLSDGIQYQWPSIACVSYSFVTIVGLFFFSTKKTKDELKRRFYKRSCEF